MKVSEMTSVSAGTIQMMNNGCSNAWAADLKIEIGHCMYANRITLKDRASLGRLYRQKIASFVGCFHLDVDVIEARDLVRLLGMTIASDLSFERHVSLQCFQDMFLLAPLRQVHRSVDSESVKTLEWSTLITSRVDYFNSVLASARKRVAKRVSEC